MCVENCIRIFQYLFCKLKKKKKSAIPGFLQVFSMYTVVCMFVPGFPIGVFFQDLQVLQQISKMDIFHHTSRNLATLFEFVLVFLRLPPPVSSPSAIIFHHLM